MLLPRCLTAPRDFTVPVANRYRGGVIGVGRPGHRGGGEAENQEALFMTDMVMGLIVGFAVGSLLLSALLYVVITRVRASQADRLAAQDETIADLRQELATDKETNRRLRHQIHALSAGSEGTAMPSIDLEEADRAAEIDQALSERDLARQELAETQRRLESARTRLTDREAKLREYREAVKEIRLSLESQDRLRGLATITDDVPQTTFPPTHPPSPPDGAVRPGSCNLTGSSCHQGEPF